MNEKLDSPAESRVERIVGSPAPDVCSDAKKTGILSGWLEWLYGLVLFCSTGIFLELCLHLIAYGGITKRFVYPALFAVMAGIVCSFIACYLPRRAGRIVTVALITVQVIYAEVQLVYHAAFGNFMSLSQVKMGGGVITNFGSQIMYCIWQNKWYVLLFLLPVVAAVLYVILRRKKDARLRWYHALTSLGALILCGAAAFVLMWVGRGAFTSAYDIFVSPATSTDMGYKNVGMYATTAQELRYLVFGRPESTDFSKSSLGINGGETDDEFFEKLCESTDDPKLRELDKYIPTLAKVGDNKYTGLMKNYNVITLCAEAFSPACVSEEMMPTLYKMMNHGIVFKNYYGTFQSVTTNGEYSFCTGLLPDMSLSKTESSFDIAATHYLPFCLGNALGEIGYVTYAYHNYLAEFYNRNITHPNMGYTFKAARSGLNIKVTWPSSDLDMMEASVDDYLYSTKPFHAYYMTFSGHYQYDWSNAMSAKNRDKTDGLPYSEEVKAYVACNLELEYALEYLIDRLSEAGKLYNTVIVLSNDHYPYGLDEDQFNELSGREVDTEFEKYKNCFICYAPGIGEDVIVDDYCCTIDILPTMLNLLGIKFDSRLLAGTDVLSDGVHIAILGNKSFLTNDFRYNYYTGEAISHDGSYVDPETVAQYVSFVDNKFKFSSDILESDYYTHYFGAEDRPDGEAIAFNDIEDVFVQSVVMYNYSRGLITGLEDGRFGGEENATVGQYLDSLYRIYLKRMLPEVKGDIPGWYAKYGLNDKYQYYDAVRWALACELIKPGDRVAGYNETLDLGTASLITYRYAPLVKISRHEKEDRFAMARSINKKLTEEEIRAILWGNGYWIIYAFDGDYLEAVRQYYMPLDRYQMNRTVYNMVFKYLKM